jgi:hypothetical protein
MGGVVTFGDVVTRVGQICWFAYKADVVLTSVC